MSLGLRGERRGGGAVAQIMSTVVDRDWDRGFDTARAEPVRKQFAVRDYVSVVLMIVIGSTTAPAAKYIVRDFPVFLIPVLRIGLAALCLAPVMWARGGLGRLIREDGWRLLLAAALCVPVNQGFFLCATRLAPTSHVALFYATCPLVVLFLAWAMRMEQPDRNRLWGVLTSVAGMVVIALGHLWDGQGADGTGRDVLFGDLLLVGAVASWGCYIAVSKPLIVRHGAMTVLAGTFLAGCLLALPMAVFASPGLPRLADVSTSGWLALAFLGLFVTPFGWSCQNLALRRFDASQVATFNNASPILTVIWGMWLFGESLTPTLVLGGVMTLSGIYWACRPGRPAFDAGTSGLADCVPGSRGAGEPPAVAVLAVTKEQGAQ
jgi:drug/metabolite transporter (DMT)-like permease